MLPAHIYDTFPTQQCICSGASQSLFNSPRMLNMFKETVPGLIYETTDKCFRRHEHNRRPADSTCSTCLHHAFLNPVYGLHASPKSLFGNYTSNHPTCLWSVGYDAYKFYANLISQYLWLSACVKWLALQWIPTTEEETKPQFHFLISAAVAVCVQR